MDRAQEDFGRYLRIARTAFRDETHPDRGLTLRELGEKAGMNFARIGDIEASRRNASEPTLRKLAAALNLKGDAAEEFLLYGLRASGAQKLPEEYAGIPPQLYRLLLQEVQTMSRGEPAAAVQTVATHTECDLLWQTEDGRWFALEIMAGVGRDPEEALSKLKLKIRHKGNPKSHQKGQGE